MALRLIPNFPGYFITDTGEVYSKVISSRNKEGKLKKLSSIIDTTGYSFVNMIKNKKHFKRHIHRLVALTFIPNPENKSDVNHKNGIRNDNRIENLEWNTRAENITHSYRILNRKPKPTLHVLQILNGKIIAEYCNCGEACRQTGIDKKQINNCCRGIQRYCHGYQWKYKKGE